MISYRDVGISINTEGWNMLFIFSLSNFDDTFKKYEKVLKKYNRSNSDGYSCLIEKGKINNLNIPDNIFLIFKIEGGEYDRIKFASNYPIDDSVTYVSENKEISESEQDVLSFISKNI